MVVMHENFITLPFHSPASNENSDGLICECLPAIQGSVLFVESLFLSLIIVFRRRELNIVKCDQRASAAMLTNLA